jgi:hypothetical protein
MDDLFVRPRIGTVRSRAARVEPEEKQRTVNKEGIVGRTFGQKKGLCELFF